MLARTFKLSLVTAFIVATFTVTETSNAQDVYRFRLDGNWTDVTDGTSPGWGLNPNNGPGNPPGSLPGPGDETRVNFGNNTVTVDSDVPDVLRLRIGVDESGIVDVNNGGVLTATEDIHVGNNGFDVVATMNVNDGGEVNVGRILWVARDLVGTNSLGLLNINTGGTVNVASHLWWGVFQQGEINISGTLNQTGGILGLGTLNAVDPSLGTATVNILSGGSLNLNNIDAGEVSGSPRLGSIQDGSVIDIQGTGELTLPGNFEAVIQNYVDANKIIGNGVNGAVDINVVLLPGGPGDFDNDDDIDGADFLAYQRDTNVGDLSDFTDNYGAGSLEMTVVTAQAPAVASVPEPSAVVLLFGSLLTATCVRKRSS
ncbi:MAG: PEP-CTERM sorting domain-containing protein [Lacipirellulaceae bacterium]